MKKILLTAMILLAAVSTAAETRYVSDVIYIPVRSGAGNEYRVVHSGLRSGARVNVLETEGEWSRIETDEVEGWMRTQYLSDTPTARLQLNAAQTRVARLQDENDTLNDQLRELREANATLNATVEDLQQKAGDATEELKEIRQMSQDAIQLHDQHQALLEKHQMLQTANDTLRAENDRLKSDQTINRWLFGAGLVVAGMLLAVIIPALKPKKRFSEWA